MIVITMTSCPPKLRGDLSKWLCEINTGVYVGQVNAKVREALWNRICEHISEGQATMVYSALNEQHLEFRMHNSDWNIKDYEGIKLITRPLSFNQNSDEPDELTKGFSKASKRRICRRKRQGVDEDYVFLDIETTGLDVENDAIIEIGVLYMDASGTCCKWGTLVKTEKLIPKEITNLTGITEEMLHEEGMEIKEALTQLNSLIHNKAIVCYNMKFDISFLQRAFKNISMESNINCVVDVLHLARKYISGVNNYKLNTLADFLDVEYEECHRALKDCEILYQIFSKLNEF